LLKIFLSGLFVVLARLGAHGFARLAEPASPSEARRVGEAGREASEATGLFKLGQAGF